MPYENIDIQLGRPVGPDLEATFDKIVTARRGGWCYEIHQLLVWALECIGFDARPVVAGIGRCNDGDGCLGNHSAVLVDLDRTYLADLGLGDGLRTTIPLAEATEVQDGLAFRLAPVDPPYWRFFNHALAIPASFDFADRPADPVLLAEKSRDLQSDPGSIFVQNLICQRMQAASVVCLTGRVLRRKTAAGVTKHLVHEDEFETVIDREFGIRIAGLAGLWPRVESRHRSMFGELREDQIDFNGF